MKADQAKKAHIEAEAAAAKKAEDARQARIEADKRRWISRQTQEWLWVSFTFCVVVLVNVFKPQVRAGAAWLRQRCNPFFEFLHAVYG